MTCVLSSERRLSPEVTVTDSTPYAIVLTLDHSEVCFEVDLASGGGLNGTTVERNFTIRTGARRVYRVRIMATVRGVSRVGGVAANWEDSRTEVLVHTGMLLLCVVCACPKIHTQNVSILPRPTHCSRY